MLLIRQICMFLKRPVFEVLQWPATELEYWSVFFSITNEDKPIVKPQELTVEQTKSKMRELFS